MATTTNQIAPPELKKENFAAYMDDMMKALTDVYAVPAFMMTPRRGSDVYRERPIAVNPNMAAPYSPPGMYLPEIGIGRIVSPSFDGFAIIEDKHMVETIEDWSGIRSPARARRRLRSGKRKHLVPVKEVPLKDIIQAGNTFIMHPATARTLKSMTAKIAEDVSKQAADNIVNAMLGI